MPLDRRAARVAAGVAIVVALATPAAAHAGDRPRPSANELWRVYPLKPTVTATASAAGTAATATATPLRSKRAARPPARHTRRTSWLPIGLLALALAAAAAVWLRARRRTRGAPAGPVAPPAPAATLWRRRPAPPAARRPRERAWPWPIGLDDAWRCEIGLDPAALSARVEAVIYRPGGGSRTLLAASPTGPGGPDWQSSEALDEAVAALAAELEAHGWEAVAGGRPHTRRLCWPHDGDPFARAEEAVWTA
jgi:hypothetical protein